MRVGRAAISSADYTHWMTIGEATVEAPKPTGPLPSFVAYRPPQFTACVTHLRSRGRSSASTASLRRRCKRTYEGIRARILNFLITGYWLREEAVVEHVAVSPVEVQKRFHEELKANYPTAASFQRLRDASRQTIADLEFAVQTQMLSVRLLAKFASSTRRSQTASSTIATFNRYIQSKWIPRTNCAAGYVVRDCRQYPR